MCLQWSWNKYEESHNILFMPRNIGLKKKKRNIGSLKEGTSQSGNVKIGRSDTLWYLTLNLTGTCFGVLTIIQSE